MMLTPLIMIELIKAKCKDMKCRVYEVKLTDALEIQTGVWDGSCVPRLDYDDNKNKKQIVIDWQNILMKCDWQTKYPDGMCVWLIKHPDDLYLLYLSSSWGSCVSFLCHLYIATGSARMLHSNRATPPLYASFDVGSFEKFLAIPEKNNRKLK